MHPGLRWLEGSAVGRAWLGQLPAIVKACAEAWSLRIGDAFPYASASLALAVTQDDGSPAVLKVQFPHREADHEADALSVWGGRGAVRLLAHDPERHALLLERCERRLAPEVFPIHWDETAANYGIGVPILQPMYAIFRRDDPGHVPLAVFPFTTEGRDAARQRLRELELGPQ